MTGDKILDAMEHIDPDLIEAADIPAKKRRKPYWFGAVAAVLAVAILAGIFWHPGSTDPQVTNPLVQGTDPAVLPNPSGIQNPGTLQLVSLVAAPDYPEMAQKPNYDDYGSDWEAYNTAYDAWRDSRNQQYSQPDGYADSLTNFFADSMAEFLQGKGNPTYSPVNVYLAMAMLAETTGGNSRQQILDLFGLDTIEQLREQASHMWNAHYCEDGQTSLLLANSLWLDDEYVFKKDTANLLANQYYASSFSGDLGTEEMNKQLQTWLNQNTGWLLEEQAQNVKLSPESVFALASTVYFTASWKEEFSQRNTKDAIFHSPEADLTVPFMNKTMHTHMCYWADNFTAIYLHLTGNNRMWLILPDEGFTVSDILESEDYLQMTLDPGAWENKRVYDINLSLPKFDVSDQKDLCDGMKAMGLTDIFDYSISDFTPMTDTPMLYVGQINHAARVAIDEKGCVGAAFTVIDVEAGAMPTEPDEIDFVLDRPFLFIVSSRDNLPLFAGVVNEP